MSNARDGPDEDGKEVQSGEIKILVCKDTKSKYIFTIPVPQKGVDDTEYAVRKMLWVIGFLGYTRVMLKADQESSIQAVFKRVKAHLGAGVVDNLPDQVVSEMSPVGDSRANGSVERGIQSAEGQIRTLVSALEERLGTKLHPDDCVMPWLVTH